MNLLNKKDVRDVSVVAAGKLLVVENSINLIIPTGKDYYYVCQEANTNELYVVHADKYWLDKNFNSDGNANTSNFVIKGLSKKVSDFDVRNEISSRINQIANFDEQSTFEQALLPGYVLELNYIKDSVIRLMAGCLVLFVAILAFILNRREDIFSEGAKKAIVFLVLVTGVVVLWAILSY